MCDTCSHDVCDLWPLDPQLMTRNLHNETANSPFTYSAHDVGGSLARRCVFSIVLFFLYLVRGYFKKNSVYMLPTFFCLSLLNTSCSCAVLTSNDLCVNVCIYTCVACTFVCVSVRVCACVCRYNVNLTLWAYPGYYYITLRNLISGGCR